MARQAGLQSVRLPFARRPEFDANVEALRARGLLPTPGPLDSKKRDDRHFAVMTCGVSRELVLQFWEPKTVSGGSG